MRKHIFINMIRLKTLLEQVPRFNLTKGGGEFSGKTPSTEFDDGVVDISQDVIKHTTSKDWVRETFKKAYELHVKANSSSYAIAKQLHVDIEGIGSGNLIKTLHAIKDIEQLSSIITSYIKLYKFSLYDEIASEWSTSWDSVWLAIKRLNPNVLLATSRSKNLG
jgi:hypothetical protein